MPLIIGLVGEKGSGKGTVAELLLGLARKNSLTAIRLGFGDILRDTLRAWDLPLTRENLQKLSPAMINAFGEGALSHAMAFRIQENRDKANLIIVDGIRWASDARLIRSFPKHLLIHITADIRSRFERMKLRRENTGEHLMLFEQFLREEQARTEIEISTLGKSADLCLKNNGTEKELAQMLQSLWEKSITPLTRT